MTESIYVRIRIVRRMGLYCELRRVCEATSDGHFACKERVYTAKQD